MAGRGTIPDWYKEPEMLYSYVVDTVIQDCKEHFLDEGLSEDVLLDFKATWEHHIENSRVTENYPPPRPRSSQSSNPAANHVDGNSNNNSHDGQGIVDPPAPGDAGGGEAETTADEITEADEEPGAEDVDALFDTDNILVCQYKKVVKAKNKWKLLLKSGIMTVNDKDFVFVECSGEAQW